MKIFTQKMIALMVVFAFVASAALPATSEARDGFKLSVRADADAEADFDYKDDDRLPKGIKHAPGIEKRVERGKGLPHGIFKKFFGGDDHDNDDDDDNDDDSLEIKIVSRNLSVSDTMATLSFATNVETEGTLYYSTDSDLDPNTEVSIALDNEHEVVLEDLEPETTYYFKVVLTDENEEDTFKTRIRSFTTDATDSDDEPTKIVVDDYSIDVDTDDVTIVLDTNVETQGTLTYSKTSDFATSTDVELALASQHTISLEDLEEDTKYYFKLSLENEDGSLTLVSDARSFTTGVVDSEAPNIMFFHTFDVETNSVNLIWITSEGSDAKVWVSTTSDVDTAVDPTVENSDLKLFHLFEIEDLEADTEHFIQVSSSDESGNTTLSETISFTTDTA